MKSIRALVACGVVGVVATAGGWSGSAISAQGVAGPLERQARAITPENPVPRRVNYQAPFYPAEAEAAGARATLTLMITLDDVGRVAEARITRTSLRTTNPAVSLTLGGTTAGDAGRTLVSQSPEQSDAVRAVANALREAALQSVRQWRYDPPAAAPIAFPVTVSLAPRSGSTSDEQPIRVGGDIKAPKKIRHVSPVYPPEAQAARVSGLVIIEARIDGDGRVTHAEVLRSIPMLDQAAVDAVMQWEFTPTLLNGVPVPVIMTVTVNFTLM